MLLAPGLSPAPPPYIESFYRCCDRRAWCSGLSLAQRGAVSTHSCSPLSAWDRLRALQRAYNTGRPAEPLLRRRLSGLLSPGFEPIIGQLVPHMASIVNLVAAELGVSIVPASMMQVRVTGIAYRQIAGQSPTTQLALAYRRGETSPVVRNFIARAVS